MREFQALLAAVLDDPADDTPRLVLADWLEETGHEAHVARAEFIRLQVAGRDDSRQAELLDEWATDWLPAALQDLATDAIESRDGFRWAVGDVWDVGRCDVTFARGFVAAVALPGLPEVTLDETTAPVVADGFTDVLLAAFDENPVERVRLELGAGEEWGIEKRPQTVNGPGGVGPSPWQGRGLHPWGPPLCRAFDREAFAEELKAVLTDRIEDLVRRVQPSRQAGEEDE